MVMMAPIMSTLPKHMLAAKIMTTINPKDDDRNVDGEEDVDAL
jgi:hypothetical protein